MPFEGQVEFFMLACVSRRGGGGILLAESI